MSSKISKRLGIDLEACHAHWQKILAEDTTGADLTEKEITEKVQRVMSSRTFEEKSDPEQMLYDGFINNKDKPVMELVRSADASVLANSSFTFADKRLQAMLVRYKGRHYPESLTPVEQKQWFDFCQGRLSCGGSGRT